MIAIALMTAKELSRRRIAFAAVAATIVCALLTGWGFHALNSIHGPKGRPISPLEVRGITATLLPLVAYLFSFVLAIAAIVLGAPTPSAEIESGVLLPVLARPVTRRAIVLGKALGLGIVLAVYAAFCGLLEFAIVSWATGYAVPHAIAAVAALAGITVVMLAFTLAVSARLQTLAASIVGIVAFGVSWLVGIVASLGPVYHNEALTRIGVISQLLLPTDALWRTAAYQLQPAALSARLATGGWSGPFFVRAPPPAPMLIWTVLWVVVALAIAVRSFSTRDV